MARTSKFDTAFWTLLPKTAPSVEVYAAAKSAGEEIGGLANQLVGAPTPENFDALLNAVSRLQGACDAIRQAEKEKAEKAEKAEKNEKADKADKKR